MSVFQRSHHHPLLYVDDLVLMSRPEDCQEVQTLQGDADERDGHQVLRGHEVVPAYANATDLKEKLWDTPGFIH